MKKQKQNIDFGSCNFGRGWNHLNKDQWSYNYNQIPKERMPWISIVKLLLRSIKHETIHDGFVNTLDNGVFQNVFYSISILICHKHINLN